MSQPNWDEMIPKIEDYAKSHSVSLSQACQHFKIEPQPFYAARYNRKPKKPKAKPVKRATVRRAAPPAVVFEVPARPAPTTGKLKFKFVEIEGTEQQVREILGGLYGSR